jgi:hypothetical protein
MWTLLYLFMIDGSAQLHPVANYDNQALCETASKQLTTKAQYVSNRRVDSLCLQVAPASVKGK